MGKVRVYDVKGKIVEVDEKSLVDRTSSYGIYLHEGKILMVKDSWTQKWGLPGGGVIKGETLEEAMVREFAEETGLKVLKTGDLLKSFDGYFYAPDGSTWKTHRHFYLVEEVEGEMLENGNQEDTIETRFLPLNEQIDTIFDPRLQNLLQSLALGE